MSQFLSRDLLFIKGDPGFLAGEKSFITVDAYRTNEEKFRMSDWNLTAKTVMHVDEWREFFDQNGSRSIYT